MTDTTQPIDDATPSGDLSGFKLPLDRAYTQEEIHTLEALNIAKATLAYLSAPPSETSAPFTYEWVLKLHHEMLGDVWEWAGKLRHNELSIGIQAYRIPGEIKKLIDDLHYWTHHKTYPLPEIAARLHHRAVQIHPFQNGNGRWSRMLANIYLYQHGQSPIQWQEDLLSKNNPHRAEYIASLKKADQGEYAPLIALHTLF